MKRIQRVRLADIAKRLNVSKVTISKALRNHPDISEKMKTRIKNVAEEMNYVPDFLARALSSKHTNIIGVVLPEVNHTFFAAALDGIYSAATEKNFEIVLTVSFEDRIREIKNIQTLLSMNVDGILISISQNTHDYEIFTNVREKKIPLVFFDRVVHNLGFSTIEVEDKKGAELAVEYAISLGYTKIAHFAGYLNISIGKERCLGYKEVLKKHSIPIKKEWVIEGGFNEEDGYSSFKKLYKYGNLPELIFAVTDPVAMGIYDAAKEVGLRIPRDIGVIGYSNNLIARYLAPPLTTVSQPAKELGRIAANLLINEIEGSKVIEPQHLSLPVELKARESCVRR